MNHFVIKDEDYFVNITTKKSLHKNSPLADFRDNFFLEGQERQSVDHYLFGQDPKNFAINLVSTWECNLRCSHCFVLHELVKKDVGKIDAKLLADFIKRLFERYPTINTGHIHFIGGEPTLRSDHNLEIMKTIRDAIGDRSIIFTATSNGFQCGDREIEFLLALDLITISLDGSKAWHDGQRKPLSKESGSPFESTLDTIRRLVAMGARDRLSVQSSLPQEAMQLDVLVDMYKTLLMSGVRYEKVIPGFISPTRQNPTPDDDFLKVSVKAARIRPCCKYRFMSNFVVDATNRVFCDYFDADSSNLLGSLSNPIDEIAVAHERVIRRTMPVLNDPKCDQCPVIGLCWGWCANTKCLKPSDHCDPNTLLKRARQNAEKGNLRNFLKNTKRNDISEEGTPTKQCCGGESCRQT